MASTDCKLAVCELAEATSSDFSSKVGLTAQVQQTDALSGFGFVRSA